jgi:hypothetical protein
LKRKNEKEVSYLLLGKITAAHEGAPSGRTQSRTRSRAIGAPPLGLHVDKANPILRSGQALACSAREWRDMGHGLSAQGHLDFRFLLFLLFLVVFLACLSVILLVFLVSSAYFGFPG